MKNYKIDENGVLSIVNNEKHLGGFAYLSAEDKSKIKKIVIPEGVEVILSHTFKMLSNLEIVELPESLVSIESSAFDYCRKLKTVKFGENIKNIGNNAFSNSNIEQLELPDSVEQIGDFAFKATKITTLNIPKGVKELKNWSFCENKFLEKVDLGENLELLDLRAFSNCGELKELNIPNSVKVISSLMAEDLNFRHLTIPMDAFIEFMLMNKIKKAMRKNGDDKLQCSFTLNGKEIDFSQIKNMESYSGVTVYEYGENGNLILNKRDQESIYTNRKECYKGATKWNHIEEIPLNAVGKILDWNKKYDVLPHKSVIMNMPKSDIDLFYKNNNAKNWASIVKSCTLTEDANRETLFELAYTLGVFSNDGKESKVATDFIMNNIIGNYDEFQIHSRYSGLSTYFSHYNANFAKFYMYNFIKNPNFLTYYDIVRQESIDYTSVVAKEFDKVLKAYPNKKVITRQDNERLTPELVISYFTNCAVNYKDIDPKATQLANMIGLYGYSEDEYKRAEEWYLRGLLIEESGLQSLKASRDYMIDVLNSLKREDDTHKDFSGKIDEKSKVVSESLDIEPELVEEGNFIDLESVDTKKVVTYELLEKSNPLGAILGNATNCCQILGGAGERCLEYGMCEPNSGFVIFRNDDKLIGQAWAWYDEKEKTVCLDNIEVPASALDGLKNDFSLQKEFVNCLIRFKNAVEMEMGKENVEKVTIGLGYNDISKVLKSNFKILKDAKTLTNYNGYTDAKKQFIIENKQQLKNIDKNDEEERQI